MTEFDRNVFINCPFDADYEPILQAILFTILYLGFEPRLALEREDSGESRLEKIRELIRESRFSIHDLSRCRANDKGEIFRLNMPFELGVDYGCRQYFGNGRDAKRFLILEEEQYRYQRALSDLSGSDIRKHGGDFAEAMTAVRNWLRNHSRRKALGPSGMQGKYVDWQEWHWETMLSRGYSEKDILKYPTFELIESIKEWLSSGEPASAN